MTTKTLPVVGMSCAACASSVESMLKSQNGVRDASVNYANNEVYLNFDEKTTNLSLLQESIKKIGYELIIITENPEELLAKKEDDRFATLRKKLIVAFVLSLPVFILSMLNMANAQLHQFFF